jgi:hypothetical protein
MKRFRMGTNVTVFLLFFGVALLESIQSRNWLKAIFWVAIALVFLFESTPWWPAGGRVPD